MGKHIRVCRYQSTADLNFRIALTRNVNRMLSIPALTSILQIIKAARLACETDEANVAENLLAEGPIHLRPWIEPPSPRDPGIARIL